MVLVLLQRSLEFAVSCETHINLAAIFRQRFESARLRLGRLNGSITRTQDALEVCIFECCVVVFLVELFQRSSLLSGIANAVNERV